MVSPIKYSTTETANREHQENLESKRVVLVNADGDPYFPGIGVDAGFIENGSILKSYETQNTDVVTDTTYVGKQDIDDNWCIKKVTTVSEDVTITYANISNNPTATTYAQAWSDRLTLNYTEFANLTFAQSELNNLLIKSTIRDPISGEETNVKPNLHNSKNELLVNMEGHLCTENSTNTPLTASSVFTGEWEDTLDYNTITIGVNADQDSATDGLSIEWSANESEVNDDDKFTIMANRGKVFTFSPARRYFRLKYTNGGIDQTVFNVQTVLRRGGFKASSHRIKDMIIGDDDAELMKAVVTAQDENGDFILVRAIQGQTGYNLKVSLDQIEETTNSVKEISYAHAELHEGNRFVSRGSFALGNGATQDILVTTPNTLKWAHTVFGAEAQDGAMTVTLYEDTTVSANGTLDGTKNRNRNSATTPGMLIHYGPTVTGVGTQIFSQIYGSGKTAGGGGRDAEEYILKQNTKYLFRLTNNTTSTNNINYVIDWYEHTNLN